MKSQARKSHNHSWSYFEFRIQKHLFVCLFAYFLFIYFFHLRLIIVIRSSAFSLGYLWLRLTGLNLTYTCADLGWVPLTLVEIKYASVSPFRHPKPINTSWIACIRCYISLVANEVRDIDKAGLSACLSNGYWITERCTFINEWSMNGDLNM